MVRPQLVAASHRLLQQLHEDWVAHSRSLGHAGFQAVAVYRFGCWKDQLPRLVRFPFAVLYLALLGIVRHLHRIELSTGARIGRRPVMSRLGGIVVSPATEIGDDCHLERDASVRVDMVQPHHGPRLGDRVRIGAGAMILGAVTVGDDACIGENAVVTADVPASRSAFTAPGRRSWLWEGTVAVASQQRTRSVASLMQLDRSEGSRGRSGDVRDTCHY